MKCHLLSPEEFRKAEDARMALAKSREVDPAWLKEHNATYGWASLSEVTAPCAMWFVPWYFDPNDPEDKEQRDHALAEIAAGRWKHNEKHFLSIYYWQDWSDKRPPICVLTPNGKEWVVDACSTNGDGWKVTGEPPTITCHPSIMVPGYHGFLRNGEFTLA